MEILEARRRMRAGIVCFELKCVDLGALDDEAVSYSRAEKAAPKKKTAIGRMLTRWRLLVKHQHWCSHLWSVEADQQQQHRGTCQ